MQINQKRIKNMRGRAFAIGLSVFMLNNLTLPAFSEPEQKTSSFEIMTMIDDGLDKNYEAILSKSSGLSDSDRLMILSQKKKEPIFPFLLNLFLGAGIGSFVAGDTGGGLTELIGEVGGLAIIFITAIATSAILSSSTVPGNPEQSLKNLENSTWVSVLGAVGAGVGVTSILGFRIYGLVQPFSYSSAYNSKLQGALAGNKSSFQPYFTGSEIGVSMAF